jgi:hypothetical protein
MPKDLSHLDALNTRLRHEKEAIARSKSEDEIKLRKVWIDQIEREIADEYKFLGIDPSVSFEGSDEDLLNELNASNSKEYKMPNKIATTSEEAALEHWIIERMTYLSSDQLYKIKAVIDANPPGGFEDDYFDENAARDQAGSSGSSLSHDETEHRAIERDEYEKYERDQDGRPIDPPLPFSRNDGGNASFSSRWVQKNCKFAAWPKDTDYRNLAELELLLEEYGPDKLHDMIAKLQEEKAIKPLQPGQRVIVKQRGQNLPGTFVRVYDDEYVVVKIDGYESKGNLYNPDNVTPAPNQLP